MAFGGLENLLAKMISNYRDAIIAQPQILATANRRLLSKISDLAMTSENDEIMLLMFHLRSMFTPIEGYATLLLRNRLKEVLPSLLEQSGIKGGEAAKINSVIDMLDLPDVLDNLGGIDISGLARAISGMLAGSTSQEERTAALGILAKAVAEVIPEVTAAICKELDVVFEGIFNSLNEGLGSVRKIIEKYIIKYHKKVVQMAPAWT